MKSFYNFAAFFCLIFFSALAVICLAAGGPIGALLSIAPIIWAIKHFLRNKNRANFYEQTEIEQSILEHLKEDGKTENDIEKKDGFEK